MTSTSTLGENSTPPRDPHDPPRRRANQRKGHGTSANDRPPIISVLSRETGEQRFWGGDHADRRTWAALIAENVPLKSTILYTDAWQRGHGSHPAPARVRHSIYEWARDDDGDGRREGHGNTCEGAGPALRTSVRPFRGVHTRYLHRYVATYEALVNATQVTSKLMRRMGVHPLSAHSSYT
jgi:hypothetical protein